MATRDIYTTAFDEDVQTTATDCPDCDGTVRTTDRKTICEDCGLVLKDNQLDRGSEWSENDRSTRGSSTYQTRRKEVTRRQKMPSPGRCVLSYADGLTALFLQARRRAYRQCQSRELIHPRFRCRC
ncbi:TFIIB-type zinc ribbon-containing protein [Natronorubrum halophilum]|uniref:TFIIB-type zinc ribbon-containing protein n=1 Tax=Natronorubrum halophilum TaxID=1702106 RepID=UPI000EF6C992|nr:TFIIB-type zinc ribbon-containing protein [Natronorubrum halophilum]